MNYRIQLLMAILLTLLGLGALLGYDLYFQKHVWVEKVAIAQVDLAENQVIQGTDLVLRDFPKELVPRDALSDLKSLVGKATVIRIPQGSVLTRPMVDWEGLTPKEGEVIFPIPKEVLYAVNGSLRKRDKVDISLVLAGNITEPVAVHSRPQPIIEKAPVVFVRTEDNQSVKDTEKGDTNQRETATGRVATVELLLTKEQRDLLIGEIEKGYKLWISRVES